ncbi:Crp/Fnr family transcriptional regulator [Marinifilum sp. RC60d5]|uniref:Crp/Fnr family transcriptional regulator n=1 Tax=Marinifilum sp. RC60d5 TaxID=3458414 RepID=UPI004035778C
MFSELANTSIFKGLKTSEIIEVLHSVHYNVHWYEPESTIAFASDRSENLFILLEGHVKGEMTSYNNKNIIVSEIHAPDTFAEGFLFADKNKLLVDIIAITRARVLIISKCELLKLLNKSTHILNNYLVATSNRFVIVSEKLKFLMFNTVRSKLAIYILDMEKESVGKESFRLGKTHEELATLFAITRPALTRNLLSLKKDGLIEIKNKEIKITDREKLIQLLN